jgi:thymidylate synthase
MAHLITATTLFNAWEQASTYLYTNGATNNMLIKIEDPCNYAQLNNWITGYNPADHTGDDIKNVVNTIFPYKLHSRSANRAAFFQKYESIYGRTWTRKSWGTYFQRLISYGKHFDPAHPNQLERAITALSRGRNQKSSITFHLTDSKLDANTRPRGAPCWHFGELICHNDRSVDLIAVYRNHDYFNKAFGNYIGLSKLLKFLCDESGRTPNNLLIHSVHADYGCNKSTFKTILRIP